MSDESSRLLSGTDSRNVTSGSYGLNSESNVVDVTGLTQAADEPVQVRNKSYDRKRWISLYVIYFTMFLSSVTFSIVISSIYPYLRKITNNQVTTTFLGYVVAIYSLGQLVGSPIMGLWSDYQHAMIPIQTGLVIIVVFNIIYSYAFSFPSYLGKYIVLISRFLIGFGGGTAAVGRSYVSAASYEKERPSVFGAISAAGAIGFIVGPLLGLVFVPLGGQGVTIEAIQFHFDMYTGPAYLSSLLAIINMILVAVFFREYRLAPRKDELRKRMKTIKQYSEDTDDISDTLSVSGAAINASVEPKKKQLFNFDCVSIWILIVAYTVVMFGFSVYETISTPYSMDDFAWTNKQGVLYNNILFGTVSIISASNYIGIRYVVKYIDERTALVVGLLLMAIGFFIIMPMGNDFPKIGIALINPAKTNTTEIPQTMTPMLTLSNATYPVGCRYPKLPWCTEVPRFYLFQYIIGVIVFVLGFPASFVLCITIYSMVLGRTSQGVMMGLITAAGSLGRFMGPVFVSFLYDHWGPQITFAIVIGTFGLAIIMVVLGYYRIVPNGQKRGFSKRI